MKECTHLFQGQDVRYLDEDKFGIYLYCPICGYNSKAKSKHLKQFPMKGELRTNVKRKNNNNSN